MQTLKATHLKRFGTMSLAFLIITLVTLLSGSSRALAISNTTVTTTTIADDSTDGGCDLYEALLTIALFNDGTDLDGDGNIATYHECSTGAGPQVIVFGGSAAGATITLPEQLSGGRPFSTLPYVTDNVTLTGPVVIDGGGPTVNAHIFITAAGGKLTLMNMVVQNGYTSGGGGAILSNNGTDEINIINSSIMNNVAEGNGGAINAVGRVNIMASNFSGNMALGLDANGSDYIGQGGAIYVSGYNSLNISLSNFAGNIAAEGGGAIFTTADSGEISDSVFNGNIVNDNAVTDSTRGGAAIYNGGNNPNTGLIITRVAFNGNLSFNADGGAIFNAPDGYLHIRDSSFNGNIAGDLANIQMGGAIYNQEYLDVQRVMFLANLTPKGNGGAVGNDRVGEAYFGNVTFTANGAPDGNGGAIWNGNSIQASAPASKVYLYNVTFSLNTSPNNGATIFNQTGATNHIVNVANTIVDGIGILGDSCNVALTSQGYNIDSANTCGFNQPTDKPDTDPGLESLSFNGGPLVSLLSHALSVGSEAIDAGSNAVCANQYVGNLDQRSDPRPKGLSCDIGAFETDPLIAQYASNPMPPGPIVIGNTSVGNPITNTFTILSVGNVEIEVANPLIATGDASEFQVITFPSTVSFQEEVVLQCNASSTGDFTSQLSFTTNDPDVPAVTYTLECHVNPAPTAGFGSEPTAPGPFDFGEVEVGNGDTGLRSITFYEAGDATLNITNIGISGAHASDFTMNTSDVTIPNGGLPIGIQITCTPSDFGIRTALLNLSTNDPLNSSVSYNLICEGVPIPPPPLTYLGTSYVDGQGGINSLDGAFDIAVSPDGSHVYVTGFNDNALTVFSRDAATGALSLIMSYNNVDMIGPQMVEVSPDGLQVYVTARTSDSLLVFNRNPATGIITLNIVWTEGDGGGSVVGLNYPYGVIVSPDNRYIYVSSFTSGAVAIFSRDSSGNVNYEGAIIDGANLYSAYLLAMSSDGKHIYVSGGSTSGSPELGYVTVYERNILDGSLTFVDHYEEGDLIGCFIICFYINGLSGAWGLTVSPDGNHVYVAGANDDAVVRFIRDPFDGTLTYGFYVANTLLEAPEAIENTEGILAEGIDSPIDVKVSPDNRYVYVTGSASDAVAVFSRDLDNGILTQVQVIYPFFDNPPLDGAWQIGIIPDGTGIYVTGINDDSVIPFHTANPYATLTSLIPASAQEGSGNVTVRVQGVNFVPGAIVRVDGEDRPTTFNHPAELEVVIPASDLASAGTLTLDVFTPAPGGGVSLNSLTFTVTAPNQNPIPSIDYLIPQGATAGDPALFLTITGVNFINSSTVQWNGINRPTTYVSSTELEITVSAPDIITAGSAVVTVLNSGPGGGTSNPVLFDIAVPGQNPIPSITFIDPRHTAAYGAGSKPIIVTVTGQNFILGAQAQWNGQNRPTQYISETEIRVTLLSFDLAFGGSGAITVINPGPGGGTSNPYTFTIFGHLVHFPLIRK